MNYCIWGARESFRGCVRALRWDEGGAQGRCSTLTPALGKQWPSPCSLGQSQQILAQSSPCLPLECGARLAAGQVLGWNTAGVFLQSRTMPACFPQALSANICTIPNLFSPCKSNTKSIAFGGSIILEHVMYFQNISYLRDLMEKLTKIHCTDKRAEVGW